MSCFVGSVSKVLFKDESGKAERWEERLGCPEQAVKGPSLLWVGHILMLFMFFLFFEVFFFLMWTIFKLFLEFVITLLLCYVLVYDCEIEPTPSALEDKVLTSGLPGKLLRALFRLAGGYNRIFL